MDFYSITNQGDREINEDSVRICERGGSLCVVVADGLGGHGRGEEASMLVADEMIACFEQDSTINCIRPAFLTAQQKLLEEQKQKRAQFEMKTTAVMFVADASGMVQWGHVGDSRLYDFKKNRIKSRTLDHSVPQMLTLAKDIKEREIRFHPDRNKLLRVMGVAWTSEPFVLSDPVRLQPHHAFLLCTDGFWEWIDERDMIRTRKDSRSAREWIEKMANKVVLAGSGKNMDNYTAAAVCVE